MLPGEEQSKSHRATIEAILPWPKRTGNGRESSGWGQTSSNITFTVKDTHKKEEFWDGELLSSLSILRFDWSCVFHVALSLAFHVLFLESSFSICKNSSWCDFDVFHVRRWTRNGSFETVNLIIQFSCYALWSVVTVSYRVSLVRDCFGLNLHYFTFKTRHWVNNLRMCQA